ncbi:hypothetical protein DYBT9275_03272 [Dyadobacter sp. CECT 9275]|uniref:Uncharacterized protein n=1 Tax=Dyadobacter helix TaxID=2822344 RepID=A0A916JDN6_9BACT|nr:hypothetical protein DYBT9275_03272 [Dyadobacter sp. CECT 9275]
MWCKVLNLPYRFNLKLTAKLDYFVHKRKNDLLGFNFVTCRAGKSLLCHESKSAFATLKQKEGAD